MPPVASPETTCWMKMSTLVPEIRPADGFVLLEVGRGARHHHPARLEQVYVIGEIEREGRVLLDQEHAHPLVPVDGPHDAKDLPDHERSEPQRGLVQEQEARPRHEG